MKTVTLDVRPPAVKAVHTDMAALLAAGGLNRTESGQVESPYEAVKVEFLLQAA